MGKYGKLFKLKKVFKFLDIFLIKNIQLLHWKKLYKSKTIIVFSIQDLTRKKIRSFNAIFAGQTLVKKYGILLSSSLYKI